MTNDELANFLDSKRKNLPIYEAPIKRRLLEICNGIRKNDKNKVAEALYRPKISTFAPLESDQPVFRLINLDDGRHNSGLYEEKWLPTGKVLENVDSFYKDKKISFWSSGFINGEDYAKDLLVPAIMVVTVAIVAGLTFPALVGCGTAAAALSPALFALGGGAAEILASSVRGAFTTSGSTIELIEALRSRDAREFSGLDQRYNAGLYIGLCAKAWLADAHFDFQSEAKDSLKITIDESTDMSFLMMDGDFLGPVNLTFNMLGVLLYNKDDCVLPTFWHQYDGGRYKDVKEFLYGKI